MAIKICLDAGHYGKINRSPVVKEYYEAEMNWKLHLLLKEALQAYGIQVITTRSQQEKDKGMLDRGQTAKGCDLFLSIHSNYCDTESVDRPVVIVPYSGVADDIGKVLGQCIQDTMGVSEYQLYKKKSEKGDWDWYTVIQGAVSVGVPGIILEHSFHTNTNAAKWLLQEHNLEKLAKAEAAAIAAYYGLKMPDVTGEPTPTYDREQFIREVQEALGAPVTGKAGLVTIGMTVAVSAKVNAKHAVVKPLQKRLNELGYTEVGAADGTAGPMFTSAVLHFQQDHGCTQTGALQDWDKTWHMLLWG